MSSYKIIFTGPVGAGKTTAISSISDIPPVSTEEKATDEVQLAKNKTTVAMDYGKVNLNGSECVHLYGTPGQERFDFMWEILTKGGLGLVLLLDNTRPKPFTDLSYFLSRFDSFIQDTHVAIGVTRMDINAKPTIDQYHDQLQALGLNYPVFSVDARRKEDIASLIKALVFSLDPCAVG
ncbi:MAG: ATP/GTP-binding protein [Gammaproteobacteria bacterium]|nr:ATP/GTP-binding protein [Gammaproteobacteria bacterium]MDH5800123.1 ATP/GTP-binding protein [Gammaproteobacteria bacterium]